MKKQPNPIRNKIRTRHKPGQALVSILGWVDGHTIGRSSKATGPKYLWQEPDTKIWWEVHTENFDNPTDATLVRRLRKSPGHVHFKPRSKNVVTLTPAENHRGRPNELGATKMVQCLMPIDQYRWVEDQARQNGVSNAAILRRVVALAYNAGEAFTRSLAKDLRTKPKGALTELLSEEQLQWLTKKARKKKIPKTDLLRIIVDWVRCGV